MEEDEEAEAEDNEEGDRGEIKSAGVAECGLRGAASSPPSASNISFYIKIKVNKANKQDFKKSKINFTICSR